MSCTLESTLSSKELVLEQAFPWKYISPHAFRHCCQRFFIRAHVNEHDWAALWLVDWLLRIWAWLIFRENYFYKNFLSERVDSKGLYGRWRLRVIGSWPNMIKNNIKGWAKTHSKIGFSKSSKSSTAKIEEEFKIYFDFSLGWTLFKVRKTSVQVSAVPKLIVFL